MKNRCSSCGSWNDPLEWPEEERANYDPNLCYVCARQKSIDEADAAEDADDGTLTQEEADALEEEMDREAEGGSDD